MLNLRSWAVMLALGLQAPAAAAAGLVIDHATVLPMTGAAPLADTSVVIQDGQITALLRPGDPRPRGVTRIDARGKFLVPGLTDAHVHLMSDDMAKLYLAMLKLDLPTKTDTQDAVLPYLSHGVTQIFNLQATPGGFAQKAQIASGQVLGPTILSAAMIDGDPPNWPLGMTRVARTPEEGRAEVRKAAAEGYQLIKPYSQLGLDTFTAIVDEARKLNLPVVGHIPGRGQDTAPYMQPGFGMVAHAEEYAQRTKSPDLSLIPRYVELAKASNTGLIATLTLDDRLLEMVRDPRSLATRPEIASLHPSARKVWLEHNPYVTRGTPGFVAYLEKIVAFNKALVKAFADAGIPILTGTDSSVPGVVPGFALPDELAALVAAGLTNEQALLAATRAPCVWLKANCGAIAPGMRADLLLLDANPLTDIASTRKIHALVLRGRLIGKSELGRRMTALTAAR
ncbi:MAG: amidohydrolase family protein [Pseudomonadota bacterium]